MTGSRRSILFGLVIVILLFGGVVAVQPARAMSVNGLDVKMDCTSWTYDAYTFTADRNNTGYNSEAYDIIITDGAGDVIHMESNPGIGIGTYGETGATKVYNQGVPAYNPLKFTWSSRAGNTLDVQIVYTVAGSCPGLPTFGGGGKGSGSTIIDGEVQFDPGDARLNRENKDRAAPVAIYCMEWGIEVRVVDYATSRGIDPPAVTALYPDVESVGVPDVNTLLMDAHGVQLYRLTTGEFAVFTQYANENKAYIFVWDQCPVPTVKYHAAV